MEEMESPTERLEEDLHEMAEHVKSDWLRWSALMSAIIAVLAAVSGLESGHAANEAMLSQIEASNAWNYYQAKGIKAIITEQQTGEAAAEKVKKYHEEQQTIKEDAEAKEHRSKQALHRHEILSQAVTLFQVAIAMTAIALMTKRRRFLFVALSLGILGIACLIRGWVA